MVAPTLYSILRIVLDAIATSQRDQAKLQGEVLALRRQVHVLKRQIKRVNWTAGIRSPLSPTGIRCAGALPARMLLAALAAVIMILIVVTRQNGPRCLRCCAHGHAP